MKLRQAEHQPLRAVVVNRRRVGERIKARHVPPEPRECEFMLLVERPQVIADGSAYWEEYRVGDVLQVAVQPSLNVTPREFSASMMNTERGRALAATTWEQRGDYDRAALLRGCAVVVTLAKPGYLRTAPNLRSYEQLLLVRVATAADAVALHTQPKERKQTV